MKPLTLKDRRVRGGEAYPCLLQGLSPGVGFISGGGGGGGGGMGGGHFNWKMLFLFLFLFFLLLNSITVIDLPLSQKKRSNDVHLNWRAFQL